jgi:hypothetical protein
MYQNGKIYQMVIKNKNDKIYHLTATIYTK